MKLVISFLIISIGFFTNTVNAELELRAANEEERQLFASQALEVTESEENQQVSVWLTRILSEQRTWIFLRFASDKENLHVITQRDGVLFSASDLALTNTKLTLEVKKGTQDQNEGNRRPTSKISVQLQLDSRELQFFEQRF